MKRLLPYVAYAFVVGMSAFGHWRIAEANQDDKARACVQSWEIRGQLRDMAEVGYRRNASTLIGFAGTANPDRVAAYQQQVELDVVEIRATLPDPTCDLATARERLR